MISLIEPFDETVFGLDMPPEDIVIVAIYLEKRLEFVNIVLQREYPLEMTHST